MWDSKEKTIEGYRHDKIYLRSRVKVPCFGKRDPPKGAKTFFWEHSGQNIPHHYDDEKYGVDDDGALTINDVSLDDAGVFFCKAEMEGGMKIIKHVIEVVQIPYASLQIHIIYEVKSCIKENIDMAKLFFEYKLKENICLHDECKIDSVHSECLYENIPSLHMKILISIKTIPVDSCDVSCTRQKSLKLQIQVSSFVKNVMEHNELNLLDGETVSPSYYNFESGNICDPGFETKDTGYSSLCGHCIPCPYNKYTEKYGSKNCILCDALYETSIRGASSKKACHVTKSRFLLQIFLVLLPILVILILCCWCIRRCFKGTITSATKICCYKKKQKSHQKHDDVRYSFESDIERKPLQAKGHERLFKKTPKKTNMKTYPKQIEAQSMSESETERKSFRTPTKSRGHPMSSKKDQQTENKKNRNHRQVRQTEIQEKKTQRSPEKYPIPPPPPLPTKSKLKYIARNVRR
ncbi:hypothetical protein JTE90_009510 [Oedothorax gibbosus]|uniref:Ig-like domain-containing protein n=1 Tax=Oedothorax gibbosus TaxID=931172 RepID=A0AAV6UUJ2_9ARAC|nr:hypothetical protein JTE90_009510 [Oedothorax gibbosus]